MSIFNLFKKNKKSEQLQQTATIISSAKNELVLKGPTLHEDLKGLIWIADGPHKNYVQKSDNGNTIDIGSISISISYMGNEEPSLIYTSQKISKPTDVSKVERPPYFPNYSGLTPEQKWVYLNLLTNPYDNSINIGFVFILYYGLEHHLLNGNFEKAFKTILKLRDVHINASFQSYSASALILSAMLHQRSDLAIEFMESLDKEHEFKFSDNLFLLCYYSFDTPIKSNDITRMAKSFGFTNMNYIKKYPDIFIDTLRTILLKKYGTDGILLKNIIPDSQLLKIKSTKERIFANMSIISENILVPQLINNNTFKKEIYNLLETAHNNVKVLLAEKRKAGKPLPVKKETKPKKEIVFDSDQEKSLLNDLNKNSKDLVNRHFTYIYLQDFYYKYRSLSNEYIEKCKEYCLLDINSLEEMFEAYVKQEIDRAQQLKDIYEDESIDERIAEIKEQGFIGNIPAFTRLVIIYEKEGNIEKAIEICERSIELKLSEKSFLDRIEKLKTKQSKSSSPFKP